MAQWIKVHRNSSFVNPVQLPLLCEKTGATAVAQPGLTAGRQQADKMLPNVEIVYWMKYLNFNSAQKDTVSL